MLQWKEQSSIDIAYKKRFFQKFTKNGSTGTEQEESEETINEFKKKTSFLI